MRVVRKRELVRKVGYSAMHISRLERAGLFPRRVRLGPNAVGWVEDEVDEWLRRRVADRDAAAAPGGAPAATIRPPRAVKSRAG